MGAEVKWYEQQVMAEISKVKRSALRKIGAKIVKDAKALCPVGVEVRFAKKVVKEREPGTLRASIRYRIVKKGASVQIIAGSRRALISRVAQRFLYRDPFYARFVEYGTSRMAARPYLRPALAKNHGFVMRAFTNILE